MGSCDSDKNFAKGAVGGFSGGLGAMPQIVTGMHRYSRVSIDLKVNKYVSL